MADSLPDDAAKVAAQLIWQFGGSRRALEYLEWSIPLLDKELQEEGETLTEEEEDERDLYRSAVIRWITEYRQQLSLLARLFELR